MKIKFLLVIMIAIGSIFFPFFGSSAEEKKNREASC
jgi:hypothetical protein